VLPGVVGLSVLLEPTGCGNLTFYLDYDLTIQYLTSIVRFWRYKDGFDKTSICGIIINIAFTLRLEKGAR
jgi:hypothetical protein